MPTTNYAEFPYHPTAEQLVDVIRDRTQRDDSLFFRVMVGFYFSMVAGQMRCMIATPDKGDIPVNMFALNLAPSGYGKTHSMNVLEEEVVHLFEQRFTKGTFPLLAQQNLIKLADERANTNQTDPAEEHKALDKEFKLQGKAPFSFAEGTTPAVKQLRQKLLLANAGSMNLIMDEVGKNMAANGEVFDAFIELYDKGLIKGKLVKSTAETVRSEEMKGKTPANLLMFGVPETLLDGDKTEALLNQYLEMGYARRSFFGYVKTSTAKAGRTAESMFDDRVNSSSNALLSDLADRLERMADMINVNKKLVISRETCIKLNQYQLDCEAIADQLPAHRHVQQNEIKNRYFKALKLAGAYAFIDDSPEVTWHHVQNAIRLAEDSGEAFALLMSREQPCVKLAKYIAAEGKELTEYDLASDLPFYRGAKAQRDDMMNMAISYGYKNNIIIKKSISDSITFYRGESLKETNLAEMVVSYSDDMTTDYQNKRAPWERLHELVQQPSMHWVAHHLKDGYRNEENCLPGFNLVVIDIDGGVNLSTLRLLMKDHKYLLYTTKRHTEEEHRFRLILPANYELKLDAKDYKEFMLNVFDSMPFEVRDRGTNQRGKKWLTNPGHYEYNDGDLFDVLPFIPKTTKNAERDKLFKSQSQQSMDNLERWVINNIGDGNRNNMLLRYAKILVDGGFAFDDIRVKVLSLNDKIIDKLDEVEIMSTIMVTVMRDIAKRP